VGAGYWRRLRIQRAVGRRRWVERYAQGMRVKTAFRLHGSRIFLRDELRQTENQVLEEVREDERMK